MMGSACRIWSQIGWGRAAWGKAAGGACRRVSPKERCYQYHVAVANVFLSAKLLKLECTFLGGMVRVGSPVKKYGLFELVSVLM